MAVRGEKVGLGARVAVPKRAGVIVKQSFDGERVETRPDAACASTTILEFTACMNYQTLVN